MNPPQGNTAVVVIHGIGEPVPFETLDHFARGVVNQLESQGVRLRAEHRLTERTTAAGASWTESFVRILPEQDGDWSFEIHEYYWAYLAEGKITVAEIWKWLDQVIEGSVRFYKERKELIDRYKKDRKPYWFRLTSIIRRLRIFYPLIRFALWLIPAWPYWRWLEDVRDWLYGRATRIIVDYVGDIALYTSTDQKSKHFWVRQRILRESYELFEAVLKDASVDRVIVAGHSLGSVIAYDTLNRLTLRASLPSGAQLPLAKLQGLITFGSPLDLIAFFFRERIGKTPYIRRQILEQLHGFKSKPFEAYDDPHTMTSPIRPALQSLPWVNYYHDDDPLSSHIDFYHSVESVVIPLTDGWGWAHNGYWNHPQFYADIAGRFL